MPDPPAAAEPALTPREQRLLAARRAPIALAWAEPFYEAWMAGESPLPVQLTSLAA